MSNIPGLYEVNTATRRVITIGMDDPLATQLANDLRAAVSLLALIPCCRYRPAHRVDVL